MNGQASVTAFDTDPTSGLPIGPKVDSTPARWPQRVTLTGHDVHIVPLDADTHTDDLFEVTRGPENERLWLYLYDGPYADRESFYASLAQKQQNARHVRIQFDSPEYFALAANEPKALPWLALGQNVQFVLNNTIYEIYE